MPLLARGRRPRRACAVALLVNGLQALPFIAVAVVTIASWVLL